MTIPPRRGVNAVSIRSASINFLAFILLLIGATLPARATDDGPALRCVSPPTGGIFLEWHGETGYTYFVQVSKTDNPLAKWTWAPLIESGNDQPISYEVDATPAKGFFRLKFTDQEIPAGLTIDTADFDGDGISNLDEIAPAYPLTPTDPLDADSDHDGLPDKYERDHGLDPNDDGSVNPNNGPDGDPDGDGLSNLDEWNHGTDPNWADSDGDGVSDWDELFVNFTNPLTSTDSDGDGIPDDFEKHLARQLLAFQPDPASWGTYYAGLVQGDLDATYDYTGDGVNAGELYIALRPIPAAGAPDSEYLVERLSRRNELHWAYYRAGTPPDSGVSLGFYTYSRPFSNDAAIMLVDHANFTSGYLTSQIGGQDWGHTGNSAMDPWFPDLAGYYSKAYSGFLTASDIDNLGTVSYRGYVRQAKFRVIATRVNHEGLDRKFLKIQGKGPYGDEGRVITEVLFAEPVSILIPKGRFLSDWFEFNAPMVEGRDTVVKLVPAEVAVVKEGEQSAPSDGLIIKKTEIVRYRLLPEMPDAPVLLANQIQWYWRILKWDGTYGEWTPFNDGHGHTFTAQPKDSGIYEVKASVGGQDFYLTRIADDPHSAKTKGENDCFGVVDEQWQISVRNQAKANLGSVAYAKAVDNDNTSAGDWKCNLFVGHKASDGGATVPKINGRNPFSKYYPTANQWAYIEIKPIPGWELLPEETYPQPGFVVARGAPGGTGHTGFVDYDGAWISAGFSNVNRKADLRNDVSLRSGNSIYQPARFRKYEP